jgi:hypothetical protein
VLIFCVTSAPERKPVELLKLKLDPFAEFIRSPADDSDMKKIYSSAGIENLLWCAVYFPGSKAAYFIAASKISFIISNSFSSLGE